MSLVETIIFEAAVAIVTGSAAFVGGWFVASLFNDGPRWPWSAR